MENSYHEPDLLRLVANGDRQAYRQLFDRHWGQVYGTCLRLTKSPELSKDLAQEIFLKLWEQRSRLPEVKKIEAWLYTVSRNMITDFIRKNVLAPSNLNELEAYLLYDPKGAEQRLEYLELEKLLREAVARLPTQLQQVFLLSRNEELSHEQIARRMGISLVSSKTYMVRALAHIRKYITEHSDRLVIFIICLLILPPR